MGIFNKTKERVCFVHVPKCGGQSIKKAIEESFSSKLKVVRIRARSSYIGVNLDTTYEDWGARDHILQEYREGILRYFLADPDSGLVMGHYRCSSKTVDFFNEDWKFITLLRDPVSRFISNYFFNVYKDSDHFKMNQSLEEFVDSPHAKSWGNICVRYFTDNYEITNSSEDTKRAISTLEKFQVVGVLEQMDHFVKSCKRDFGWSLNIGSKNQSPVDRNDERRKISEDVMRRIELLCEPSMEVYEYAKSRQK